MINMFELNTRNAFIVMMYEYDYDNEMTKILIGNGIIDVIEMMFATNENLKNNIENLFAQTEFHNYMQTQYKRIHEYDLNVLCDYETK